MTSPGHPEARPAATLVVFRRGPAGQAPELLMLVRSDAMRFGGGAAVFPGGKVDAEDRELAEKLGTADLEDGAARIAAIRETLEESGLAVGLSKRVSAVEAASARAFLHEQGALAPVLERFGWTLDTDALTYFARWCPRWPGAFDTRFFIADLGTGAVDVAVDATENTHLFWTSAENALAMEDRGEVKMLFPTLRNLERLAQFADFNAAREDARVTAIRMITPAIALRDGVEYLTIPEDLGYPVTAQLMESVRRGFGGRAPGDK